MRKGPERAIENKAMASLGQLAIMAAIVTSLAYFPFGLALIFLLGIAGVSYETLITFGGNLGVFIGLIAWWLLVFAGGFAYAALVFPWEDKEFGWPGRK